MKKMKMFFIGFMVFRNYFLQASEHANKTVAAHLPHMQNLQQEESRQLEQNSVVTTLLFTLKRENIKRCLGFTDGISYRYTDDAREATGISRIFLFYNSYYVVLFYADGTQGHGIHVVDQFSEHMIEPC